MGTVHQFRRRPELYEISRPTMEEMAFECLPQCPSVKIKTLHKMCKKTSKFSLSDDEVDLVLTAEQYTTQAPERLVDAYIYCLKIILKKRKRYKWLG